jgi:hypothetical protein
LRVSTGRGVPQHQRGQGLVELTLFVPLFLLLLFSMLDFGFALYSNLTLDYASREGARVGAALATGNATLPCAQVDGHVIAAVQRVLKSAGIAVPLNNGGDSTRTGVNWIRIYNATAAAYADGSGYDVAGNYNQWTYSAGNGPNVDGTNLDFVAGTSPWSACSRSNGTTPDEIGVAISYTYAWQTPLVNIIKMASRGNFVANVTFLNKTVMNLNPTYP